MPFEREGTKAGFRKNRSRVEEISIFRNIMDPINEWQATFYTHFDDLEKASDSIHREGLWELL